VRRRRVVVGVALGALVALLVAASVNTRKIVRVVHRRGEMPVVTSRAELEAVREVVIGGASVRLGVSTTTPPAGGLVLVYGEARGPIPADFLRVRRRGETGGANIGWNRVAPAPQRLFFAQSTVVSSDAEQVIEVVHEGRVVAAVTVDPAPERFHTFMPILVS
jgi:hypothetical protein